MDRNGTGRAGGRRCVSPSQVAKRQQQSRKVSGEDSVTASAGAWDNSEWRQHWTLLIPCIAGIVLCAVHGYSLGVMIIPLEQEFGWSRAEITTGPLIISFIAL